MMVQEMCSAVVESKRNKIYTVTGSGGSTATSVVVVVVNAVLVVVFPSKEVDVVCPKQIPSSVETVEEDGSFVVVVDAAVVDEHPI